MQSELKPDYEAMSFTVLATVVTALQGTPSNGSDFTIPTWNGPDRTATRVLAILYSSLCASVTVAFIAILGRQWLTHYAKPERGLSIDTIRNRKLKMDGMDAWCFNLVMDSLPLLLHASLLLLGYGLSNYLLFLDQTVAGVVIGFTSFCLFFYFASSAAAIISEHCPFQTPLSLTLRYLARHLVPKAWRENNSRRKPRPSRPKMKTANHIVLPMWTLAADPDPLFSHREIDWDGYVVYSNCVIWMFEKPIEHDTVMAIVRFIPEIVWHSGIKTIPLEKTYDNLLECFDDNLNSPTVLSRCRDRAYLSAKAVLHMIIQRRCLGNATDIEIFDSIAARHPRMGCWRYDEDSDLESTLCIIDIVLGAPMPTLEWQKLKFTIPHHSWMAHILLYRAWDTVGTANNLSEDVTSFIKYTLSLDPSPSTAIVADCLLMIGLILGIGIHVDDLTVVDKRYAQSHGIMVIFAYFRYSSRELKPQIDRIYESLTAILQRPEATDDEIDRALQAMELVTPFLDNQIAQKSYELFHVIMDTPISLAFTTEKKWAAARIMMDGAYNWDKFLPWVEDPSHMLAFLTHHFELIATRDENWEVPIQNALRALAYASNQTTIDALSKFDPTQPLFVRGIHYACENARPFQLRKAVLFFLPLVNDKWFNAPEPFMSADETRKFCTDWFSNIDGIEHTYDVQRAILAVLLSMINSPSWRPHIDPKKWKLLEYFTSVPDDSQPLRRCLDNPDLMDAIRDVDSPLAMVLWLAILWMKYTELIPVVKEQLEAATKEVVQGSRKTDLDMYLSVMDVESKKAEEKLKEYNTWSTDPAAIGLRKKIDCLKQAKEMLSSIKELPSYTNAVAGPSGAPRE